MKSYVKNDKKHLFYDNGNTKIFNKSMQNIIIVRYKWMIG